MCSKGNPSTTTAQTQNTSQSGNTQGQQMQTGFSQLGPNPETLALYNNFLQGVGAIQGAPFDPNMMQQTIPWTAGQDAASNYQIGLGMQGMPYASDAAALLRQGGQSTVGQIPGVASSLLSPWANQAVNYGQQQGQNISNYATNLAAQGPQLEKFSQAAIDRYMSPYINDVVNTTQNQFTNANAQQGNALLGQGIRAGNAFGGDRAGVAAAQLGNQQQLAQAPVIAGLYDKGYNTALGEFNTQNALATQLGGMAMQGQQAGAQLGMQGYGLGLNAAGQANALAAQALAQNQNAALQGGSMLGQLGGLQYSQNLAGGAQANQAAQIYPAYLQNLYATQAANAQMANAYPFQTSSWYGGLLQGIGGLTGTQQQNVNAALSNYLQNQQGVSLINGTTTPPQPNSFMQAAGLGLAGLGLLAKRGGSVPRMPRRAMGGGIPRYAAGGPAGGRPGPDLNFLTGGFGDAIQPRPLQATHLAAPNTTATDIKLPVLSTLTFPGMSSPSASTGTQGSQSSLGQASALLGNKQVASGLKGIGNFIFGNNDVSVGTLGGGQSEATNVGLPELNGGFRRGGTVAMRHYPSGGYVGAFDDRYVPSEEQPAEEESADSGLGNWVESLVQSIPKTVPNPYADDPEQVDDQPQSQPSVAADEDLPEGWTAPESDEVPTPRPGPEQRDEFVPDPYADELALPDDQPQAMTPSALGQPERQAGVGPERGGGRGGRGRPERIDFPGQGGAPQGFLSRWASNPLTQFGLGLASAKGAGLTGVAEGLNMGLSRVQAQQIANDKLDKNYKLDTSGDTTRLVFPTHAIDTKLPTGRAATRLVQQQQRKIGPIPRGWRMSEDGTRLERIPGGPKLPGDPDEAAAQGTSQENIHGEEYIQTLTASGDRDAALVEAVGNYAMDPNKAVTMYRGARKEFLNKVLAFNPDYDARHYAASSKSINEFLSGGQNSPAGQITFARTAIGHAGEMSDALEDLKSIPGFMQDAANAGVPFLSYLAGRAKNASVRGTPEGEAINRYLTASTLYGAEVSKLYSGSSGSQEERNTVRLPLDPNLSYRELAKSVHTSAEMLQSRTKALDERYETALNSPGLVKYGTKAKVTLDDGRTVPLSEFKIINKRAEESLTRIKERADTTGNKPAAKEGKQPAAAPAAAPAAPKPPEVGEVRKGYRFKGGDPGAPTSWEKVDQL